jgi:drug/metabolite transporter (DMT)-like permease
VRRILTWAAPYTGATMIAVLGGVGAALAWAVSTLCSSRSSRMIPPFSVVSWVMLIGLVVAAPAAVIDGIPRSLHGGAWVWLAVAGVGNVAGLTIAYHALRLGQVAVVAPLISTEGAMAALIALLAGETLTPGVGVVLAVIAAGICLASIPGGGSHRIARAHHRTSVALAVVTALAFGASLYATGRAGAELPSSWVVLAARLVGVVGLAIPLALRGRLRLTREAAPLVVASGICEVLGFYAFILGARHGIAVAAVLSSQFAALSALGAYLWFGERLSRAQLAGVAAVISGVAVLSALQA